MEPTEVIARGSKSFAFASLLLGPEVRDRVAKLYHWCRFCDDVTDGSLLGQGQIDRRELVRSRVDQLRAFTHAAFDGSLEARANPAFHSLRAVVRERAISEKHALDLLDGMQHDAEGGRIADRDALVTYCYQVAGTVGLMMCSITGLRGNDPETARAQAVELGIALQMTNIARDVAEDLAVGRVYLPETWLREAGIPEGRLLDPEFRPATARLVARLLDEADRRYVEGLKGLRALPFRAALAVSVAAEVYRAIGARVRRQGVNAWKERAATSGFEKLLLAVPAVTRAIASRFLRDSSTIRQQVSNS